VGVLSVWAWTVTTSFILFYTIHKTIGLRVDAATEAEGLDTSEHGAKAYIKAIPYSEVHTHTYKHTHTYTHT
jgi:ammonia channel protein AmtB